MRLFREPFGTCLTKTYTQDGLVVFVDVCTKEAASAPVGGGEVTTAIMVLTPSFVPVSVGASDEWPETEVSRRQRFGRDRVDTVEKVESLTSLQICQNTNDIFD
jgi:hypothetical protein